MYLNAMTVGHHSYEKCNEFQVQKTWLTGSQLFLLARWQLLKGFHEAVGVGTKNVI